VCGLVSDPKNVVETFDWPGFVDVLVFGRMWFDRFVLLLCCWYIGFEWSVVVVAVRATIM
jgi:hypothetical protein